MSDEKRWLALALVCMAALLFLLYSVRFCVAHDYEHPELDGWYASLKQNDVPTVSCCGKADSYFCDEVHVRDGKAFCTITDERADEPLSRRHVPIGTEIEIPPNKMNKDPNPTGHSVVFLSSANYVWCFVFNGGS